MSYGTNGPPLTPEEKRLCAINIARLQAFKLQPKAPVISEADARVQRAQRKAAYDAPLAVTLSELAPVRASDGVPFSTYLAERPTEFRAS